MHYHIIIPYVHFHSPVSPGSPSHGLTQPTSPWGHKLSLAQLRGAPAHSSALAGPKGTLLCPSHKAAGAGHDLYNTLYYSKSTKQGAKTIPPSANKAMCSEGWDTFLARIENHSHSWWQGIKKKPQTLGSFAPLLDCARGTVLSTMLSGVCAVCRHYLKRQRDAAAVPRSAEPHTCTLVRGTGRG